MTKKRTIFICAVAVILALVLALYFALSGSPQTVAQTRTVQLKIAPDYENYLTDFTEKEIIEDGQTVTFHGVMPYDEKVLEVFDNVSVADGIDEEQSNIIYDCSLDMESLRYVFTATLLNEHGEVLEIDKQYTDAFVTENGGLDAYIEIDGETYLMSEYADKETLDNCFFHWIVGAIALAIVVVIVAFIVVSETAEQSRAKSNLDYNKELERRGMGVEINKYITDQDDKKTDGHRPANYRFGFASFGDVGCEVAAAYNALISLGKSEMLSKTINAFETLSIEFASGFGHLGSNPTEMYKFFRNKRIEYKKCNSFDSLKKAVDSKNSCDIIMSRWNKTSQGLHTFYVKKTASSNFKGENWHGESYDKNIQNSLSNFNDGSGFIVGYVVWR